MINIRSYKRRPSVKHHLIIIAPLIEAVNVLRGEYILNMVVLLQTLAEIPNQRVNLKPVEFSWQYYRNKETGPWQREKK